MLIPFIKEENILNKNPFIKDEVQFNLIHRISDDSEALLLRLEDDTAIIARTAPKFPMWIWVEDNSNDTLVQEVVKEVKSIVSKEETFGIVSSLEVTKQFLEQYDSKYNLVMEMESYYCPKVIIPKSTSGIMTKPSMEDLDIIAEYCAGFVYSGFGKKVSKESQLEGAKRMITSGNLYILKVNDEIVSMASIAHRAPRHVRINNVYTPPDQRKKGYASELIAYLSNLILTEGLTPVLYTDLSNSTSNKVYKGVGYIECGKVYHYRIANNKDN